ncbi:MAG: lysophospholipid acyltransferase family protein [Polyangiales bacterium]
MAEGSIGLALLTCAETFRICAPTIADAMFGDVPRERSTRRLKDWAARVVALTEMDIDVHGLEHVDPNETYVVMSNHRSNYDIFVLFHAFPGVLRMVAKSELAKIPILSGAMSAAEFVFIERADRARALEAMQIAEARLHSGISVWIAPEGTRSEDGALLSFKKGGFMLALGTKTKILPVTLLGTGAVLPPKEIRVHRGKHVDVRIHAPIDPAEFGVDRRDELMLRVREAMASALPDELREKSMSVGTSARET